MKDKRTDRGYYYRGGKRIDITWGDKISESLKSDEMLRTHVCPNCMEGFQSYLGSKIFCSKKCKEEWIKETDIIKWKTRSLGANILSAATPNERKTDFLYEMIEKAIGTKCKYCGEVLEIDNLSLDHKEPIRKNWVRRDKKKKASKEIRMKLDHKDNLHIICSTCNQMKSDISHDNWIEFLEFLEDKPKMKDSIFNRLSISRSIFSYKRK